MICPEIVALFSLGLAFAQSDLMVRILWHCYVMVLRDRRFGRGERGATSKAYLLTPPERPDFDRNRPNFEAWTILYPHLSHEDGPRQKERLNIELALSTEFVGHPRPRTLDSFLPVRGVDFDLLSSCVAPLASAI